jgi:hypothetical protein
MVRDEPADYDTWKALVANYEKTYGLPAPMNNRGIWRLPEASGARLENLAEFTRKINLSGSGSALSLEAGEYEFRLTWSRGTKSVKEPWVFRRKIEAGHVYEVRSEELKDNKVRIWIADVTNDEIPATLEFTSPGIGERIGQDRFERAGRNGGEGEAYAWKPKGLPETRDRVRFRLFAGDANGWDTLTVYTSGSGIVSAREAVYVYRLTGGESAGRAGPEPVRAGIAAGLGASKVPYELYKGTYNGLKAEMYIRNDKNDSLLLTEEETKDRILFRVIHREGLIPGFTETRSLSAAE